tara:strand:- start:271 stop:732 length:462 start_codon:yes stop_codon:yes gene_type:complete
MINKNSTKEEVLEAVKQNVYALLWASASYRDDRDVMLEVVKQNGMALEHASDRLRIDREVVREAVKQNVYSMQYTNWDVVLEMVKCWAKYMEDDLESVKNCGFDVPYATDVLYGDRDFRLTLYGQDANACERSGRGLLVEIANCWAKGEVNND